MKDKTSRTLNEALDFVSSEARESVTDALYCYFSNEGQTLEGNNAESDARWFARTLYETNVESRTAWERLEEAERARWMQVAEHTLRVLPYLVDRMAARYGTIAAAMRSRLEVETAHKMTVMKARVK